MRSEEARQQARAEGLTLRVAENSTGYFGVSRIANPGLVKPYQVQVSHGGKLVYLGTFATPEEAALRVARTPEAQAVAAQAAAPPPLTAEGQAAAGRAAAAPPLTSLGALQQAEEEGLLLRGADNKAGYVGVSLAKLDQRKPYRAHVRRDGKLVHLGCFATAEEGALCVARSPEGQDEEARQQARAEELTLLGSD